MVPNTWAPFAIIPFSYYLAAIRKASSILQLHPDSDLVDDSLLLMGLLLAL